MMKLGKRNAIYHILISFALCLILILVIASWFKGQDLKPDAALKALLPVFPDWSFQEKPMTYFPGTLFEYIDGASEAYLSYDFKELLVAQYQKTGTEAVVTLEIYDMGTPLNAFGIFSSERYPDNPEAGIGVAGYQEEEVLNFISGRYYVKLLCYNGEENTANYLKQFGLSVESKVKDKSSLPGIFRLFPEEGRIKNSEKFIKKNFMGFDFLKNGYAVTYRQNQVEFEAYIIEADSITEAKIMLQRVLDFYSGEKVPFIKKGDQYHQKTIYGQHVFLGQVKNYLFGLSRIPQDQMALALKHFNRLRQALESEK